MLDLETIIIILFVLVILDIILTITLYCNQNSTVSLEGFDVNKEAIENLASVLNTGNMRLTNLEVTGDLTTNNAEVTNNAKAKNLDLDGVVMQKHSDGYIQIPAPVEINNAMTTNHNVAKPGIITGNIISTTSLIGNTSPNYQPCIDYAIGTLTEANKYGLPNGSWVSGIGKDYTYGDPARDGGQRWFAKKAQTPTGDSRGLAFRAFYTNNSPLSPWLGPWYREDGTAI